MKIGIMGGTFNPIHNAHLMVAQMAMEEYGLEQVWFMTSGNPPHKNRTELPEAEMRQEMVRLAIEGNDAFQLCSYEVESKEFSYTAETLRYLSKEYREHQFCFIIGEDSLHQIRSWYRPEVIAQLCPLLVFPRAGNTMKEDIRAAQRTLSAEVHEIHAPVWSISSSMIRKRICEGKTIRYLAPDKVAEYIAEHKLYSRLPSDDIQEYACGKGGGV